MPRTLLTLATILLGIQNAYNNHSSSRSSAFFFCHGFLIQSQKPGVFSRYIHRVSLSTDGLDNDESPIRFDAEQLSNRIKQLQQSELKNLDKFTTGLQQRVQELESAQAIEEQLENNATISLPVICFDALLPNQRLEGSTEDPTFIRFLLEETGLGGWFVMTSFEYRSRKIRRSGVLCKVEYLDAAAKKNRDEDDALRRTPTSVDFVIAGKRRCRVAGEETGLQLRIGRWRRIYDENGEESVLGWGMERLTDLITIPSSDESDNSTSEVSTPRNAPSLPSATPKITDPKQWSKEEIEYLNLENDTTVSIESLRKAESLVPYVEEWYNLASNVKTYQNTNVTAGVRIQHNQPMIKVDPDVLMRKVLKELGDRPDPLQDPTGFCFWVGALINPLPALGVSLEIRGNLLEVRTLDERLKILELGLIRSIQNLKGERPL